MKSIEEIFNRMIAIGITASDKSARRARHMKGPAPQGATPAVKFDRAYIDGGGNVKQSCYAVKMWIADGQIYYSES